MPPFHALNGLCKHNGEMMCTRHRLKTVTLPGSWPWTIGPETETDCIQLMNHLIAKTLHHLNQEAL